MQLPDCPKLVINSKNGNYIITFRDDAIVKFLDVVLFLLLILVAVPSFMSMSSLFRSYDFLLGIDQKSGNQKYPHLSFA